MEKGRRNPKEEGQTKKKRDKVDSSNLLCMWSSLQDHLKIYKTEYKQKKKQKKKRNKKKVNYFSVHPDFGLEMFAFSLLSTTSTYVRSTVLHVRTKLIF